MTETDLKALTEPFPWARPPIDPPVCYALLRARQPVASVITREGQRLWLVTRYDDVRAVLADPRVSADTRHPGFPRLGMRPPSDRERPFLRMDPPEHTVFRKLLAKSFTFTKLEALRPRIQRLVDGTVDKMLSAPGHPVDLMTALAWPVPSTVLSWILGVRVEDSVFFNRAAADLLNGQDTTDPQAPGRARQAGAALRAYIGELAEERRTREDPGDDILGRLEQAVRDGLITPQDVINTGLVLIVAGHDTTASMTAMGMIALLQDSSQMAALRAEPGLIESAVEELLRYLTIVHLVVLRVATEDITVAGQVIPAGEGIVPLNISANRDDARYPQPDRLDVHRDAHDHLAFGYGVHQCLGQSLARIELQVIFGTLLRRLPGLRLAVPGEDLPFRRFSQINGVSALPVTW